MAKRDNRAALLAAGHQLMTTSGYAASGVQEIADVAGTPKGSFYNHFRSKEDFCGEVIERHADRIRGVLDDRLTVDSGSPLERLKGLFEGWVYDLKTQDVRHGCLVGNLCQEVANQAEPLREVIGGAFDRVERPIVACLERAIAVGELPKSTDPQQLGEFIYNAWQGALLRAKSQDNPRSLDAFLEVLNTRLLV